MHQFLETLLRSLEDKSLKRTLTTNTLPLNFSSNDYLGLSKNTLLIHEAMKALREFGGGSRASRLIGGNLHLYNELEKSIAKQKGFEEALLFNSGYQGNIAILSTLLAYLQKQTTVEIFMDKLSHASLYKGVEYAKIQPIRYKHLNHSQLEEHLSLSKASIKLIITEAVFGMDGDILPYEEILTLAQKYDAYLYIDEAHGIGVLGENGYGLAKGPLKQGYEKLLAFGTFGKALGSFGSYLCCSKIIKEFLINKASGFIYTTALPPSVVAFNNAAWNILPQLDDKRKRLKTLSTKMASLLNASKKEAWIFPYIIGDPEKTNSIASMFSKNGIFIYPVKPPTVPPLTSRLRIALTADHTENDIENFAKVLEKCAKSAIMADLG